MRILKGAETFGYWAEGRGVSELLTPGQACHSASVLDGPEIPKTPE